jgi:2'-hydroxyisoflavone reductase
MKILVIGGTVFLGRHIVEYALKEGHEVTLFNRGQHNPELFPEVEKIHGDRNTGYGKLTGRSWDAVIDTCGYTPGAVEKTAEILKDSVKRYVFISSINAYKDMEKAGIDETYPEAELPEGASIEEMTMETYGPLKVLCEKVVKTIFPTGYVNIRSGLIVGPFDPTDRFTYWVNRIAKGGQVLCPGDGDTPIQFIDVRDLAKWSVKMALNGEPGVYNGTGPDYELTMGHFLDTCRKVCNPEAELIWVDEGFMNENEIMPWSDMPAWAPDGQKEFYGLGKININEALHQGLNFLDLEKTVTDTLEWDNQRPQDIQMKAGITAEKEKKFLKKFKSKAEKL